MARDTTLAKVVALVAAAVACLAVLVITLGGAKPSGAEYAAMFTSSSEIVTNSDVRVAGVVVGEVEGIDLRPDNLVRVRFRAEPGTPLSTTSRARLRYRTVVGDKYLELLPPDGDPGTPLPPGGVIPVERTTPALDLDELYDGFGPLFQGLQPDQVNQLTGSLVAVLQGQGGAVESLLARVATLTDTLADKDAVITSLVDNLNGLLAGLDQHSGELDRLVVQLTRLVEGLSAERDRIGRSLEHVHDLTGTVNQVLERGRPAIADTVHQVDRLATLLNAESEGLEQRLRKFPGYYATLGRVGAYSSAFQFYLCGVQLRLDTGVGPVVRTPMIQSGVKRCQW